MTFSYKEYGLWFIFLFVVTVNKSPKQSKAKSDLHLLSVTSEKPGPNLAYSSINLYKISFRILSVEFLVLGMSRPVCSFCSSYRMSSRFSFSSCLLLIEQLNQHCPVMTCFLNTLLLWIHYICQPILLHQKSKVKRLYSMWHTFV